MLLPQPTPATQSQRSGSRKGVSIAQNENSGPITKHFNFPRTKSSPYLVQIFVLNIILPYFELPEGFGGIIIRFQNLNWSQIFWNLKNSPVIPRARGHWDFTWMLRFLSAETDECLVSSACGRNCDLFSALNMEHFGLRGRKAMHFPSVL